VISRRQALLSALGLAATAVVAACTGRSPVSVASSTPSAPASPSPSASPTTTPLAAPVPSCVVTPAETEGPYFVDEKLNRSDIRADASGTGLRPGTPLTLAFGVYRVSGSGCAPWPGVQVDVWHCDAGGVYSDVSAQRSVGENYLRGYQLTDDQGVARFQTIFPGWYMGRTVHIHFKVRAFSGTQKTYEFTSQVFFDDATTDQVYAAAPYSSRPARDTRNAGDMVYTSGGSSGAQLLMKLTGDGAGGYAGTFSIGLQA
jgi:protocatechuate 3,4-dioxygenase beta subunit